MSALGHYAEDEDVFNEFEHVLLCSFCAFRGGEACLLQAGREQNGSYYVFILSHLGPGGNVLMVVQTLDRRPNAKRRAGLEPSLPAWNAMRLPRSLARSSAWSATSTGVHLKMLSELSSRPGSLRSLSPDVHGLKPGLQPFLNFLDSSPRDKVTRLPVLSFAFATLTPILHQAHIHNLKRFP